MKHLFTLLMMVGTVLGQADSVQPANGFIPDKDTACRVAVAFMTPILGKGHLHHKKPIATLDGDIWTVKFVWEELKDPNAITTGAPATIQLNRKDGHVIATWRPEK